MPSFGLQQTVLNSLANGKIQRLFKAFACFSSKGKFSFQGLFKTILYIQLLFKPVRTLLKSQGQFLVMVWHSQPGLPLNIHFKIPWLFTDFSLTFNCFPDPFGRPILAIFIHRLFEDYAQIFELADLICKHSFSNIACKLWKLKFPEAD